VIPDVGPMDHAWDLLGEWQAEFEIPDASEPVRGKMTFRSWTDAELVFDPEAAANAGIAVPGTGNRLPGRASLTTGLHWLRPRSVPRLDLIGASVEATDVSMDWTDEMTSVTGLTGQVVTAGAAVVTGAAVSTTGAGTGAAITGSATGVTGLAAGGSMVDTGLTSLTVAGSMVSDVVAVDESGADGSRVVSSRADGSTLSLLGPTTGVSPSGGDSSPGTRPEPNTLVASAMTFRRTISALVVGLSLRS